MPLASILRAALIYFAAIFALGIALGTLRVTVIAPRMGETAAVLAELPAMLLASWLAARAVTRRHAIARAGDALATGALAFALLMGAELALAIATGTGARDWLAGLGRVPGALGLAGQLDFALLPVLARPREAR